MSRINAVPLHKQEASGKSRKGKTELASQTGHRSNPSVLGHEHASGEAMAKSRARGPETERSLKIESSELLNERGHRKGKSRLSN